MYAADDVPEGVPEYARARITRDEAEIVQEAGLLAVPSICRRPGAVQMDKQLPDHVTHFVWILME